MDHLDVIGLLRAAQMLERDVSVALMYSGLRVPQFRLLDILAEAGQATVTEMSEKLRVTRATASVMINELIGAGVIAMAENPSDRRSFHVRLTEHGANKLRVARSDIAVLKNEMLKRYSPEMVHALNEFALTASARAAKTGEARARRRAAERWG